MDRQSERNFFVVAVAGMFCLFNASVVSAQTATDLNCSNCVGPGEVAPDTVGWFSFSPSARNFLTNQANDVNGFDARVDALLEVVTAQADEIADLQAQVATLEAGIVPNLGTYLRIDETNPQRPTAWFEAVNVMVVNGTGTTAGVTNGLGNLIVGYDEFFGGPDDNKGGSHNLVVGPAHNYSSFGGFVAGVHNSLLAENATVSGGSGNTAQGLRSSVSGGRDNAASEIFSSVSGGRDNAASGIWSSVSGGTNNTAEGPFASVSGGHENTASGPRSSVSGGEANTASGQQSSVSGGSNRDALFLHDWVAGGLFQDN